MSDQLATRAQVKQIITLFGKAGVKDRNARLHAMRRWTCRTIWSTTDLTADEVGLVVGEIKALLEKDDYPVPPPPSV